MIKCKNEIIFNLFKDYYLKMKKDVSYNSIMEFCNNSNLTFGIINYKSDDSLYIATENGICYIANNGEVEEAKGNYSIFKENDDTEPLEAVIKNDINEIENGNKDIICINNAILEEV